MIPNLGTEALRELITYHNQETILTVRYLQKASKWLEKF